MFLNIITDSLLMTSMIQKVRAAYALCGAGLWILYSAISLLIIYRASFKVKGSNAVEQKVLEASRLSTFRAVKIIHLVLLSLIYIPLYAPVLGEAHKSLLAADWNRDLAWYKSFASEVLLLTQYIPIYEM